MVWLENKSDRLDMRGANLGAPFLRVAPMRVLLIDDNRLVRVTTAAGLRALGLDVTEAESGMEALQLWAAGEFDAVITDIMMPDLDGYELAQRLRILEKERSDLPPIRLVALSGIVISPADQQHLAQAFDLILEKPIRTKVLFDLIQQ